MTVAVSTPAMAQSDNKKALFEKGAAHYQAEEFGEAAEAFEKLYAIEPSNDVLFAWAQAERFADNCEGALPLFDKLMKSNMSETNKKAVNESKTACKERLERIAQTKSIGPEPVDETPPSTADSSSGTTDGIGNPSPGLSARAQPSAEDTSRVWYRDPIAAVLTGSGVVTLGVGIGFYVSGNSANGDAESTQSAAEFASLKDRAQSRGRIGVIGMISGGALLAAGITWYLVDPRGKSEHSVAAWATGEGAGIAVGGRF